MLSFRLYEIPKEFLETFVRDNSKALLAEWFADTEEKDGSETALAEQLSVTLSELSNMRAGKRKITRRVIPTFVKLAKKRFPLPAKVSDGQQPVAG